MSNAGAPEGFAAVKDRLAQIADAVDDESLSLDEVLDLYEEAVALGFKASDLLETGIVFPEEDEVSSDGAASAQPAAEADGSRDDSRPADAPFSDAQ